MSVMEEHVTDEQVSVSSCSPELNVRVSRLEHELTQTNDKLRSTEKQLLDVERRCAISEATCSELKQQIAVILTSLEGFKTLNRSECTTNCSIDVSTQCDSQVDVPVNFCTTSSLSTEITSNTATIATTTTTMTASSENVSDANQWPTDGSQTASVAECVKVAAESAVEESRFIYDPETRMYYDCLSGYYYDAEKSLYYEPHSGMYFYYDSSNHSYKYHSQVDEDKFKLLTHIIFKRNSTVEELNRKNRRLRRSNKQNAQSSQQPTANGDSLSNEPSNKLSVKTSTTIAAATTTTTTTTATGGGVEGVPQGVRADCSKEAEANSQLQSTDTAMEVSDVVLELPQNNNYTERHEQEVDTDSEEELEDGELTSSASENESEAVEMVPEPVMQHCTPCIRLMVTCSDCLSVGSLFIITCTGGTIGRDVDLGHTVVIPDPQVSKMHCSLSYSEDRQRYVIKDHASSCGTFVNDKRLAKAKTISEPHVVYHGDVLKISSTTFELHIHPRLETCSSCEPGCVQQPMSVQQNDVGNVVADVASQKDKEQERRRQLKRLRTKFGLAAMNYENHPSLHHNKSYQDRAAQRRDTVGSDEPVIDRVEPSSSVHRAISEQNIGHKLLAKLGWKEGESLGKSNEGILEPINVEVRVKASAGLGAYGGSHLSMDDVHQSAAAERWLKTQDRYARLTAAEQTLQTDSEQTCNVSQSSLGPIKWTKGQGSNA